jgi:acylphosphatase
MLYANIFKQLNENKVRYLIVGGIAVNLHGFARATADLDILISMEDENVAKFIKAMKASKMLPKVPVKIEEFADKSKRHRWRTEKNMKVFSLINPKDPMEQLDVLLESKIDFEKIYKRRKILHAANIKLSLVAIGDLIHLKRIAARERDKLDIKALRKIKELKHE